MPHKKGASLELREPHGFRQFPVRRKRQDNVVGFPFFGAHGRRRQQHGRQGAEAARIAFFIRSSRFHSSRQNEARTPPGESRPRTARTYRIYWLKS